MPKRSPKVTPVTIYFPNAEHRALKMEAASRGVTLTAIIRDAINSRPTTTLYTHDDDLPGAKK